MGGCQSQSPEKTPKESAISPDKLSRDSPSVDKYKENCVETIPSDKSSDTSFVGFHDNLNLLCLDQFVSRYTGEIMHRWRPATIVYVERDTGQIKVHYDGTSSLTSMKSCDGIDLILRLFLLL